MRKLFVNEFLTLDGVMQGPGDPNEDRSDGFDQGGWQLPYFDEVFGNTITEGLQQTGGLLLGRRTYEIFAGHWPNQPPGDPLASLLNEMPKYVVSTSLSEPLAWQNSTVIRGDLPNQIGKLKQQSGMDIQVIGSGELVQSLIRDDLIDEFRLMIHPLVLGNGKHLFREGGPPLRLQLADSKTTSKGVLILTYTPEKTKAAIPVGSAEAAVR
jgi:dihydrofolate reductase